MAVIYYTTGDTIRGVCTFTDFAPSGSTGALIDPTTVVVNTYDINYNKTGGPFTATKQTTGIYTYDWTLPATEGTWFIEFVGTISAEPIISRQRIVTRFNPNS